MTERICPFCGKEFSSGASYRVHKSRYHRGQQEPERRAETPVIEESANPEKGVIDREDAGEPQPISSQGIEGSPHGSGWGWIAGLGGLALLVMLILFGRGGSRK